MVLILEKSIAFNFQQRISSSTTAKTTSTTRIDNRLSSSIKKSSLLLCMYNNNIKFCNQCNNSMKCYCGCNNNYKTSKSTKLSMSLNTKNNNIQLVEPFGKGLKNDIKTKLPYLKSDFIDGFNLKTLSSSFFLFFACLAPAVAFGGLLATATSGAMGTVETVGATALGGILYSLFAGQPITIIGTTGPLLAFIKVTYEACKYLSLPFLPIYAWIGLWSSFMLYISSFFSLSNVVEYFTRFTDDIFSSLISVIFIYEACSELIKGFMNPAISGLQASLSLIIAVLTYFTANTLVKLRQTQFFPRKVREKIADFGPTLGVLTGAFTAHAAMSRYNIALPMLNVPQVFGTTSGRPWLIDIFSLSNKYKLLCILPALMYTILLFMDQNITVRLIMAKQNKLKKGNGIHLDMFVVATAAAICSVLGFPQMVAATVRSLAHLRSLREYEAVKTDEDDTTSKLNIIGVKEQRVSGLLIHSMIAFMILFQRNVLRLLPQSVLTGLFLYLGLSSISTTDLYDRTLLFFTDDKDLPKGKEWIENVKLAKTKLFTSIQLALLGGMWWIKGTKLGVFFPVLIGLLSPIRIMLEKFKVFDQKELENLDGEIA